MCGVDRIGPDDPGIGGLGGWRIHDSYDGIDNFYQSFGSNLHIIVYFRSIKSTINVNKKWLAAGVLIILLLLISSVYIFIPGIITVSTYTMVECTPGGAFRTMSQETFWENLPGETDSKDHYRLIGKFFQRVDIIREKGKGRQQIEGSIKIVPTPVFDSIALQWNCSFPSGLNPVKRILQYEAAKSIKENMTGLLASLRSFLEKKQNIYGFDVKDTLTRDTAMVATKWERETYPGTSDMYEKIGLLRSYAASQGAKEMDYPMINVSKAKNGRYECMVAVPVDRELKGNSVIFPRRFISWNIFMGEVRGGAASAEQALARLHQYTTDYQRTAMSIPFQSLVTERDKEPDTLKWVTRVILPVN